MIQVSTINHLKSIVKIEDVVGDFINLRRKGTAHLGLCPFHNEKTPSFSVSPAKGIYKCFSCGESGNAFSFVMKHEAMNYPEAVKWIAKKYNVPVAESESSDDAARRTHKESLAIVTEFAQKVFLHSFDKSAAHQYMSIERGFNAEILRDFNIGYAKDDWQFLSVAALKRAYKAELLTESGLSGTKKTDGSLYDRFRNRVMFPYFDLSGKVIGFTSRILTADKSEAKYINSSNTELFDKSKILFGLFQAKKAIVAYDECFLVEGNTDVMRFHQLGIANTVATSGTALSTMQVKLIQRFTYHVILLFDADNAGKNAAMKSIDKFLSEDFVVNVCILPEGEDPDSFGKSRTKDEVLNYILENKVDFFEFQAKTLLNGSVSAKDIVKVAETIATSISFIDNEAERIILRKKLSQKFGIEEKLLDKKTAKLSEEKECVIGFFAWEEAKEAIKEKNVANLVFSNDFVIEKHFNNELNTVGFTENTAYSYFNELHKLTKNISVSESLGQFDLIDTNGETKLLKLFKQLISVGFNLEITYFNEIDDKEDTTSFIDFYFELQIGSIKGSNDKSKKSAIEKSAEIISFLSETERMLKINHVVSRFKSNGYVINQGDFKKIVSDYLKENQRSDNKEVTIYANNPHGLTKEQLESLDKYGLFEKDNQLFFEEKSGGSVPYSNYIIRPLFHIESINETRKLFEIINFKNEKQIIEVDIESMVKIDKWQIFCESKGNFLFWGDKTKFTRLKQRLYADTKFCKNIENLGWQKQGFWAWANGIVYERQFVPVDSYGTVTVLNTNYYIPAFSELYKHDRTVFKAERKFVRKPQDISFFQWSEKFISVYGENSKLSTCALLTSVFSDYIFSITGNLPLVNFFGVKGTGKTEHAKSLLNFFGDEQNLLNIHKGTEYAAAVHMENFKNAFALIDEYKNSLDINKLEYLKSIYNRDGRVRGSIKAGIKTETTQVNSMALLCGQEMPTADVALFSRLVFLPYYNPEYSQTQKNKFNELKAIEKKGLTHLVEELLGFRSLIEKEYEQTFYDVEKDLSEQVSSSVDGRLIKNYAILIATFKILESRVSVAFKYEDVFQLSLNRIREQYTIMNSSNEVSAFWESLVSLAERGIIRHGDNYRIIDEIFITLLVKNGASTEEKRFDFSGYKNGSKQILYLKMSTIYNYYAELCAKTRQEIMPKRSLEYYIEHSKTFLGRSKSTRFDNVTTGWAFDYDMLGIDLSSRNDTLQPYHETPQPLPNYEPKDDNSPF